MKLPFSKEKISIIKVLKDEGYINGFQVIEADVGKTLQVDLKYFQNKPVIGSIRRVSRPGLRIFKNKKRFTKKYSVDWVLRLFPHLVGW